LTALERRRIKHIDLIGCNKLEHSVMSERERANCASKVCNIFVTATASSKFQDFRQDKSRALLAGVFYRVLIPD
jgi:hypothetical protein